MRPEGITLSNDAYYERYLGYDDVGVFKAIAKDHDIPMSADRVESLIRQKGERYEALAAAGGLLFPGAAEFIRAAAAVVPIAIASGALTQEIEEVLDRAGLRSLFPVIVGADQTERSKPHPIRTSPRLQAARALGSRPDCLAVGVAIEDSKWGLQSARRRPSLCRRDQHL